MCIRDSLYGPAITQAAMSRVNLLHDAGFKGQGMTIAVIDAGFHNVDKICLLYTSFTGTPVGVGPVSIGQRLQVDLEEEKLLDFYSR